MSLVAQFYEKEGELAVFEDENQVLKVSFTPPMTRRQATAMLRLCGKQVLRWRETDWGYETNLRRKP